MRKFIQKYGSTRYVSILIVLGMVTGGCADSPVARDRAATGRLLLLSAPPDISVGQDGPSRRDSAMLSELDGMQTAPNGRWIEASSAALLYNTGWGRAFLAAPDGRALAIGAPAQECPGIGVVAGGPETPRSVVAGAALEQCLTSLSRAGATNCGCRLLALDDTLLAPLEAFAHAPGVSARLVGLGGDAGRGPLVARESREIAADGSIRVLFSSVEGPVAAAALFPDGRAVMELTDSGAVFEGERDLRGWRRGRLTERLLLRSPDGRRVIALIGFEPEDYAREGLALARWPRAKG